MKAKIIFLIENNHTEQSSNSSDKWDGKIEMTKFLEVLRKPRTKMCFVPYVTHSTIQSSTAFIRKQGKVTTWHLTTGIYTFYLPKLLECQ